MSLIRLERASSAGEAMTRTREETIITGRPEIGERGAKKLICFPEECGYGLAEADACFLRGA